MTGETQRPTERPNIGLRPVHVGSVQYAGETPAQARERWAAEEELERKTQTEATRLLQWKNTPVWAGPITKP